MDETTDAVTTGEEIGVAHELGKHLVGGIVAFGASKLSDKLYDAALRKLRSRKA
jgi:hypothetical protein